MNINSNGKSRLNPFRSSTKYWDEESGLVYYNARFYSPSLGKWIGRDPTTDQVLLNLYLFCHNNPLARYDKDGREDSFTVAGASALETSIASWVSARILISSFGGIAGFLGGIAQKSYERGGIGNLTYKDWTDIQKDTAKGYLTGLGTPAGLFSGLIGACVSGISAELFVDWITDPNTQL